MVNGRKILNSSVDRFREYGSPICYNHVDGFKENGRPIQGK